MEGKTTGFGGTIWGRILLLILLVISYCEAQVKLSLHSNVYLPSGEDMTFKFGVDAVTQIAYSTEDKLIYAAGENTLHVINVADASNPTIEVSRFEPGAVYKGIDVCSNRVFLSVLNEGDPEKSQLQIYSSFKEGFNPLTTVQVGAQPDSLKVKDDCKTVVLSVEGSPTTDSNGNVKDAEGEILIAKAEFTAESLTSDDIKVTRIDFKAYNDRYAELEKYGVRFPSQSAGNNFSRDVEPEQVVLDNVWGVAYVSLQENNAIAEVDLSSGELKKIYGLGNKKWGYLDASDQDGGFKQGYWPIRSWFQPDGIDFYEWNGVPLLFTANEGHARDYEVTRDVSKADLSDAMPEVIKDAIEDDTKLGQLQFSVQDGLDPATGKYNDLYTFGGRSFSIWSITFGLISRKYDSESEMEKLTATYCPHLFNRENQPDDSSPNTGPEPEAIVVGKIGDRLYVFIGNEKPGTIFVYSIDNNPFFILPRFETMFCGGIPRDDRSLPEMYDQREVYLVEPENMIFLPEDKSPTGEPVLVVAGSRSGTVTLLSISGY